MPPLIEVSMAKLETAAHLITLDREISGENVITEIIGGDYQVQRLSNGRKLITKFRQKIGDKVNTEATKLLKDIGGKRAVRGNALLLTGKASNINFEH